MPHINGPRFQPDDVVAFQRGTQPGPAQPAGHFVVIATMPQNDAGAYQYRLRPVEAGPLRIAVEAELIRPT